MIVDHIRNLELYLGISEDIRLCLEYLKQTDFRKEEFAKKQLSPNIVAGYSEYTTKTKEERGWEAHDHCIDIQYVERGQEVLYYNNREHLDFVRKVEGKDKLVYAGEGNRMILESGYFAILFPEDTHISKVYDREPSQVHKVVFKISL